MRWLALVLVFLAQPVRAQGVDYEAVMAQHADRIVRPAPGLRVLELPGPVIVTCRDGRGCIGMDQSAHGAAGCAVRVLTNIAALDRLCPAVLDEAAKMRLREALETGWRFWADNTVPRQSHDTALAARDAAIAQTTGHAAGQCPIDGAAQGDDLRQMMLSVTRETAAGRLAKVFETPRLPVTHTCM